MNTPPWLLALAAPLALVFGAGGVGLLLGAQPFAGNLDRLRIPHPVRVLIGVCEVAAAVGLVIGLWFPPLALAAAVGLTALMIGAVLAHRRAEDPAKEYVPAVLCGLVALVLTAGLIQSG